MKKTLTLLCTIFWCISGMKAQSCSGAISLVTYINGTTLTQTSREQWYYFNAGYNNMFIDVLKTDTTFHWVDSVFIYAGSCSSPTLLTSYGRPVGADSIYGLELRVNNMALAATYYIRVKLKLAASYASRYSMNLATANATSCNLITNGDFENTGVINCPVAPLPFYPTGGFIIPSWYSTGNSWPCICGPSCNIVTNPYLNSEAIPHSGNLQIRISTSDMTAVPLVPEDWADYICTNFSSPLSLNKKYYVQMFYQESNAFNYIEDDGLGMYISTAIPTGTVPNTFTLFLNRATISPTVTPQFQNPTGNLINNWSWLPMGGVYTASGGEMYLTIGNFKHAAQSNQTSGNHISPGRVAGDGANVLIDDVSLTPMDLSLTPASICLGASMQLNPTACTPPYCTSTYAWLPATGISNPGIANPVFTPSVTTTYTLTQTITNAIGAIVTNSAVVTITVTPATFTFSSGASSNVICANLGQSAVTLTATSTAAASYTWLPGQLLGGTQPGLTPSVSTVYTVNASYEGCTFTQTVPVTISSVCCTSTVGVLTSANLNGATISGPGVINMDLTVGGNAISQLQNGEFLIAPNVKIDILSGSQLQLRGVHLYACSSMWQGINVDLNARLSSVPTTSNTTLIEDAIAAVKINSINSVPTLSLVEIDGAIFNRNYVGVSLNNCTTNALPIYLVRNVFTSRSLTFTSSSWPNTSSSAGGLRAAANPTTGLVPPYDFQGAAYANLKSPYNNQPAFAGVSISNVGNSSGAPSYGAQIGQSVNSNTDYFNLFDGMYYGIYASNSNVNSTNNVFQNMKTYTVGVSQAAGVGIYSSCTSLMNTKLDLKDPYSNATLSGGNRFWNCYYGVQGDELYQFTTEYGLFRSNQSNLGGTGLLPGNTGINLNSSRFQYYVRNCSFANVRYGVNVSIFSGTNDMGSGPVNGIYQGNMYIGNNYFGAEPSSSLTIANEYMNTAVSVGSPNNISAQSLAGSGLFIQSNNMNRVYRGVSVNGMNNYTTTINTNSIVLVDDIMNGTTQRGIELANSMNNVVVLTNTLSGTGLSNSLTALVYCGSNVGVSSPSVCCNYLSNAYKGFEFNNNNGGCTWKGNSMSNHGIGMTLTITAIIGPQGTVSNASDNQWSNFAPGTFGTWTDAGSNAANSKLYVKSASSPWYSPNNSGLFGPQSYNQPGNIVVSTTATAYACASPNAPPPLQLMALPAGGGSVDMDYSSGTSLYRSLTANPALLDSSQDLSDFYDSVSVSSIGTFQQVESQIYNGQLNQAQNLNSSVSPTNNAESNYQLYYQLYNTYASGTFSSLDSSNLYNLAGLCPGSDGACVYQARALYNLIYKTVLNVNENCDQTLQNGRKFNTNTVPAAKKNKAENIQLFPNPSNGQMSLLNPSESDQLDISVKDLSGRTVWKAIVWVQNYSAQISLNLKEGMYLISIKNKANESTTKKIVITN